MKKLARVDWAAVRQQLLARCGGRCEVCSARLPTSWQIQHRRARGMGGSRRLDAHSLANLLALCDEPCHGAIERQERQRAFERGFAVPQACDPAGMPFLRGGGMDEKPGRAGMWTWLTADGGYEVAPDPLPW